MKTLLLLELLTAANLFAQTRFFDSIHNLIDQNPLAISGFQGIHSDYNSSIDSRKNLTYELDDKKLKQLKPSERRRMHKNIEYLILKLSDNNSLIKTLQFFKNSNLRRLNIYALGFSIDSSAFDVINQFNKLEFLELHSENIVMPANLKGIPKLRKLYIENYGSRLKVPIDLSSNLNLTHFSLTTDLNEYRGQKGSIFEEPCQLEFTNSFNLPKNLIYLYLNERTPEFPRTDESKSIPQIIENLVNLQTLYIGGNYDSSFLDFTNLLNLYTFKIITPLLKYWKPKKSPKILSNLKIVVLHLGSFPFVPDIIDNIDTLYHLSVSNNSQEIKLSQKVISILFITDLSLNRLEMDAELKIGIASLEIKILNDINQILRKCNGMKLIVNKEMMEKYLHNWPKELLDIELLLVYKSLEGIEVEQLEKLQNVRKITLWYNYEVSKEDVDAMYKIIRK